MSSQIRQRRFDGTLKKIGALATLFSTVAAAIAAFAASDQANVSRQTLVRSLQSIVFFDVAHWEYVDKEEMGMTIMPIPMNTFDISKIISVSFKLTNGGGSLAGPVVSKFVCKKTEKPPEEPFSLLESAETKTVTQTIGPKQTIDIGPCIELLKSDLTANATDGSQLYMVGEIRYHDAIEPSKSRLTQFAQQIRFFSDDPDHLNGRVTAVGKHNCADEGCLVP